MHGLRQEFPRQHSRSVELDDAQGGRARVTPQPIPLLAFKAARSIGQPSVAPELEATVLEWRRASVRKIRIIGFNAGGVVVPVHSEEGET